MTRYDYDSEEFYEVIKACGTLGLTQGETAEVLNLGVCTFNLMYNGKYQNWTDEENARRSERIRECLRPSARMILRVQSKYLKTILGEEFVTSETSRHVEEICECGGSDPYCEICGGTGKVLDSKRQIVQTTRTQIPPNPAGLRSWLYQHSPTFRDMEGGGSKEGEAKEGVNVSEWLEGKLYGGKE